MRRHVIAAVLSSAIFSQGCTSVGRHGHTARHHDGSSAVMTAISAAAVIVGGALMAHAEFAKPSCDQGIGCVVTVPFDKGLEFGGGGALALGGGIMLVASAVMGSGSGSHAASFESSDPTVAPTQSDLERELAEVRADHAARLRVARSLENPQVRARVLTIRARDWARRHRCDVVRDLGAKVAELDAAYHAAVFETDAELQACR